jgi:Zn-dependent protease with chaperone function
MWWVSNTGLFIGVNAVIGDRYALAPRCLSGRRFMPPGEMRTLIDEVAVRKQIRLIQIYLLSGTARSNYSRAYLYGVGVYKLEVTDKLLTQSTDQVAAAVAQQLRHINLRHLLADHLRMFIALHSTLFVLRSVVLYSRDTWLSEFGFDARAAAARPIYPALLIAVCLYKPILHVFKGVCQYVSQWCEFDADAAVAHCSAHEARAMQSLLRSMGREKQLSACPNDCSVIFDPLYSVFHLSHPPTLQRLSAIQRILDDIDAKRE